MGRIEKTLFILDYISSETLRWRIQRGLNKGEAMNALARAIFFGKHGASRTGITRPIRGSTRSLSHYQAKVLHYP